MRANHTSAIFYRESAKFSRAGFRDVYGCRLKIVRRHFLERRSARDFAWYDEEAHCVYLIERALRLPYGNVLGLIRHELGHAALTAEYPDHSERDADETARLVGCPVYYDHRDVQHAFEGRSTRPAYLPR